MMTIADAGILYCLYNVIDRGWSAWWTVLAVALLSGTYPKHFIAALGETKDPK